MFRPLILALGANPWAEKAAQRWGLRLGASRFVAGEDWQAARAVVAELNRQGIEATVDYLGEALRDPAAIGEAQKTYLDILEEIAGQRLRSHLSLKLTMLGLLQGEEYAYAQLRPIVARAHQAGGFVRIDMEESRWTDATLAIYQRLWQTYPGSVGVVLQAYLYRTRDDLLRLSDQPRNFRIVKGAYREPRERAFPVKRDVDRNYEWLVEEAISRGHYVAIATHDEHLIARLRGWLDGRGVGRDRYEFQMLYGIKFPLLQQLARAGYRCRVYVPFGRQWYPYFLRRLAERPANLLFFLRALLPSPSLHPRG
ncbi:MAG: proline dehydrogenase family protein [Firmicutes bacterium]|nr:proline dehydrogenase family protein [Bacillota bacterium]